MESLIASIIFSIIATYLTAFNTLHNLYSHARRKIEESLSFFRTDYSYIPTEEQLRLLKQEVEAHKADWDEQRIMWYEINIRRYDLLIRTLNILTFGKFKHFV